MRRILAFGLSGSLGQTLLRDHGPWVGCRFTAVSRKARAELSGVDWQHGSLEQLPALPDRFDAVLSLGPLDAFARWFAAADVATAQVIALGSTGVHSKADSADASERALAERLRRAEASLGQACRDRGIALQLLRPTLIYGAGGDRSLSQAVTLARRWGAIALPRGGGLRQPVHAGDLATVIARLTQEGGEETWALDLPGGEALDFGEMLGRAVRAGAPGARQLPLPLPLFRILLVLSARMGWVADAETGFATRLERDQLFDPTPAQRRIGWQPRQFRPSQGDFSAILDNAATQQRKP